jgi:phage terminase Nu1 subunit (DNA packaging protein)
MATQNEIAKHLGVSKTTINNLIDKDVIKRPAKGVVGGYDLDECREAYIAHLRETAAGRLSGGSLELGEERARLAKEQADAKEMENEIARGDLVYISDVSDAIEKQFTKVRSKLLGVPTKVAPEANACATVKEVQAIIEQAIIEALNDLVGLDTD